MKYSESPVKITGPDAEKVQLLEHFGDAKLDPILGEHLNEAEYTVPTPIQKVN